MISTICIKNRSLSTSVFSKFSLYEKILPERARKLINGFYIIFKVGTKETWTELKYLSDIRKIPDSELDFIQLRRKRLIKNDIYKLIPFSLFLIAPLSGFLLPAYLFFFPNALPSRYVKFFLKERRSNFLGAKKQEAMGCIGKVQNLNRLDSEKLISVADVLKMEYFSLTFVLNQSFSLVLKTSIYAINALYSMIGKPDRLDSMQLTAKYRIKLNFFPLEEIKRAVLLHQINSFLNVLWVEDQKFLQLKEKKIKEIDQQLLSEYLEERGITNLKGSDLQVEINLWRERLNNKKRDEFLDLILDNIYKNR